MPKLNTLIANDTHSFDDWMLVIDAFCCQAFGMPYDSCPYVIFIRDLYIEGFTAKEAFFEHVKPAFQEIANDYC